MISSDRDLAPFDIGPFIEEITHLVVRASHRSLDWFRLRSATSGLDDTGSVLEIGNKAGPGAFDPVTQADRAVEDEIRSGLSRLFPDHAIVGEERGTTGSGEFRWIIDPIDGTRSFISGLPSWGTLVGLQQNDTPVAGWLHLPVINETYVGTLRESWWGSDHERHALGTSAISVLGEATLLCTHPSMFATESEQVAFGALESVVKMTRYGGDCVNYAVLATGSVDLVVENQLEPYDIVPLIPIIESAGGVVTNLEGELPLGGGWVVAAANRGLHRLALDILNGTDRQAC